MKRVLATGFLVMALARLVLAQSGTYSNNTVVTAPPDNPPNGHVTNWMNFNSISVAYPIPFSFYDVVTMSNGNRASLAGDVGFLFYNVPTDGGTNRPLALFGNANTGLISAGAGLAPVLSSPAVLPPPFAPQIRIWTTNLISPGTLDVGVNGIISVNATNANFTRGTLNLEGWDGASIPASPGPPFGVYDDLWGGGTQANTLSISSVTLPSPASTASAATNSSGSTGTASITASQARAWSMANDIASSNHVYQAIFVSDSSPNTNVVKVDAEFQPPTGGSDFSSPAVRWTILSTNLYGVPATYVYYLQDILPNISTVPIVNNEITLGGQPLFGPTNFNLTNSISPSFTPDTTNIFNTNLFSATIAFPTNAPRRAANNLYSIWEVSLLPFTYEPDPNNPSQTFSNIPSRIELAAGTLNLASVRIQGPNYAKITSSNLVSSANAQITVPVMDLDLGSTNGTLVISNLVSPLVFRPYGSIGMWSATWSNTFPSNVVTTNFTGGTTNIATNTFSVTNRYSVLMVKSVLTNATNTVQEFVRLRSTNVIVSDPLNIASNFFTDAQNFTIQTNSPFLYQPGISFLSSLILWSPSFPNLQNFTNWGAVSVGNTTFFSHRASPDFPSPGDSPYARFVNHGQITSSGANIFWDNYFESTGTGPTPAIISSGFGAVSVQSTTAVVGGGEMDAINGDMAFTSGTLSISNTTLVAGGEMFLTITNQLTDGGGIGNNWEFASGIYMSIKPGSGDLLGTAIQLDAASNVEVSIIWPGVDQGPVLAGFANNAVVGNLILNSEDVTSAFFFGPAIGVNAIYIDRLDMFGPATVNSAFDIDPNMKIYFAKAFRNSVDISATLNGAFGGQIQQVPGFVGPFTVPAITQGNSVSLSITMTNQPSVSPMISWTTVPNATNGLYSSLNPGGGWTLVTNMVVGPTSSKVTVHDTASNAARFYQVRVTPTGQ